MRAESEMWNERPTTTTTNNWMAVGYLNWRLHTPTTHTPTHILTYKQTINYAVSHSNSDSHLCSGDQRFFAFFTFFFFLILIFCFFDCQQLLFTSYGFFICCYLSWFLVISYLHLTLSSVTLIVMRKWRSRSDSLKTL